MILLRCAGAVCPITLAIVLFLPPGMNFAAAGPSVLEACVNPGNGNMRLVDATVACHANETRMQWNVTGPPGPAGPQGPPGVQGPPGPPGSSGGGPPFIWVCTPANYPLSGSNSRADLYVFNGSASTANVAIHILDKNGNNLAGVTIPGTSPAQAYPGETGAATVAVAPSSTRTLTWVFPQTSPEGGSDVSTTVRVTSDQPIAVGSNFSFGAFIPNPCSFLHN